MPTLAQATIAPPAGTYAPVDPAVRAPQGPPPVNESVPSFNPFLRCPYPLLQAYPDNLRQYYRGGIPQYRYIAPPSLF